MDDGPPAGSTKADLLQYSEYIFLGLFTLELFIKMVADGFYWAGPKAYMRDYWNYLDVFVVIMGYITLSGAVTSSSVGAIRTFRVLRPLRAIKNVRGMRILTNSLIASLRWLVDVLMLLMFLLLVFAIVGTQVFAGKLRQRCFNTTTGALLEVSNLCSTEPNTGRQCPTNSFCGVHTESMNHNVNGWDNIFMGVITILQTISLEGWSSLMDALMDTGLTWSWVYFILLIFSGAFFVMNLVTAVVFLRFQQSKLVEDEKQRQRERELKQLIAGGLPTLKKVKSSTEASDKKEKDDNGQMPLLDSSQPTSIQADQLAAVSDLESGEPKGAVSVPLKQQAQGKGREQGSWISRYIRAPCKKAAESEWLKWTVGGLILVNTMFLGVEHWSTFLLRNTFPSCSHPFYFFDTCRYTR